MGSQKALFVHFLAQYLRDRCPNWNKSQNSVCNPTCQELKNKDLNLCTVNTGGGVMEQETNWI